jgi:hypothetical protein
MNLQLPDYNECGLEVIDLHKHSNFTQRQLHTRDMTTQMECLRLLCHAFLDSPDTMLQEVVNSGIHLCGADSAGISLAQPERSEAQYFLWVAVAGEWSSLANSTLPHYPSACGVCLDRGTPQVMRVGKLFFDLMGVKARPVTDGILLPWKIGDIQGTIWLGAHERSEAFDLADLRILESLADFARLGILRKLQDGTPISHIGNLENFAIANSASEGKNAPRRLGPGAPGEVIKKVS